MTTRVPSVPSQSRVAPREELELRVRRTRRFALVSGLVSLAILLPLAALFPRGAARFFEVSEGRMTALRLLGAAALVGGFVAVGAAIRAANLSNRIGTPHGHRRHEHP